MTAQRWMPGNGSPARAARSACSAKALAVLGAGALVAVLAGCGSGSSDEVTPVGNPTTTGGPTVPAGSTSLAPTSPVKNGPVTPPFTEAGSAATELSIEYDDGAGTVSHWALTCDPTGGNHPHPALACRTLAAHGKQGFAPVPKGVMCPQIVSGNQTAVITGTWNGTKVSATLDLRNGCETGRWRSLSGLLPNVLPNGVQ